MLATLDIAGPIGTVTLKRPEARNSMSPELIAALAGLVRELSARADLHAVVIRGEGKAFCAGMDLKLVLGNEGLSLQLLRSLAELTHGLRALPQATIAAVTGAAIGGGCGLATVCDFAITHDEAKIGFPEVDLGVCPAVVAPWLLRKIGAGRARAVLLRGGLMSGKDAASIGIADRSVATEAEVEPAARELAGRIAQGGRAALAATKGLLNELDGSTDLPLLIRAAELSARVLNTPEAQARLASRMK